MATSLKNDLMQNFVGTPQLKYVDPNDEDFCRKLNRLVNGEGFDGTWRYGAEADTAKLYNRHEDPDADIATFDAPTQTLTARIAATTAAKRAEISALCTRYGITYAEA